MDQAETADEADERVEELETAAQNPAQARLSGGEFKKISMFKWRNSASPLISMALPNSWLEGLGLVSLDSFEVGILSHFREK
jgi:ABC-type sugar transport system ATPase subunit